ncbi:branched-chain amino acid aminotransferase [Parvularcula bermudensis HTCC2503]|uniref:Probable branched-chain-amino-acid aminotransferase n=1 Tax=Parvularcula bermudensis (strain ATCC BAA-594 / HTCC2503 / KCTC 12087) TaxID=314260 RepID=E0TCH8_PARBH|nr:aminotransferase class IV [Parvularcula bermudensis]ADM10334.1 branched-chain amino acid aminotransferase [Parvularcula bermudensis HTCC2503]
MELVDIIDGAPVKGDARVLPLRDRSFLYGDGLFETIAVHGGVPFGLDDHLDRLTRGLKVMGVAPSLVLARAERSLAAALQHNDLTSGGVLRLTVSRGTGVRGLSSRGLDQPLVAVLVGAAPGAEALRQPRTAVTTKRRRPHPETLSPHLKCAQYLGAILATDEAETAGRNEALLLDWQGTSVACATIANIFVLIDETLITPPLSTGALAGTMRARLMAMAAAEGREVREDLITADLLAKASALFLTNAVRGIVPCAQLDDRHFAASALGAHLQQRVRAQIIAACGTCWLPAP